MSFSPEVKNIIDQAKAEGHSVFSLNITGTKYIYRSISRAEFKSLQEKMVKEAEQAKSEADNKKKGLEESDPKVAIINQELEAIALQIKDRGEERLLEIGVLHPKITENTPAGVHSTIADHIMQASGFGNEEEPEQL